MKKNKIQKEWSYNFIAYFSFIVFDKAEANNPVGTAITPNPIVTIRDVKILPPTVIGKASPYPTVVNVTIDHHSASKIDPNCSG